MNIRALAAWRAGNNGVGVARQRPPSMTRRQFGRAAAGTAVLGGTLGSGLLAPGLAEASNSFAPVPIPGGTPGLGGAYHVFAPGLPGADPIDAEPATITNMNGSQTAANAYSNANVSTAWKLAGSITGW